MAIQDWENSDDWEEIQGKFNGVTGVLAGGTAGQSLKSNGVGLDPTWEDTLPDQGGNNGRFLTTNGTSASWAEIPNKLDRQKSYVTPATLLPASTPGESTVATLTAATGYTRDYILTATVEFARVTTSPETEWRFKKNGTTLVSYKSVAIPTNGQTQTHTFNWFETNVSPGDIFTFVIYSPANQVTVNKCTFIIDGNK